MNELKPCPFCGGKAEIKADPMIGEIFYTVRCSVCHARVHYANVDKQKKIDEWNRRVK